MTRVKDYDIVYISYDEPNAEENYQDLLSKAPWAKRVHGVKGFDAAHKEAARIAETENFFVVDGDNRVVHEFFYEDVVPENLNPSYVYSWSSKNIINGLIYGNGGIKLWPKKVMLNASGHEQAEDGKGTDWCWTVPYFQMNDWFSYSMCNASQYQAFRAGFREAVKLSLHDGKRVIDKIDHIAESNRVRLIAWMTLGSDITNGTIAIFAARLGFLKTVGGNGTEFDVSVISDFDWIENYWTESFQYVRDGHYQEHYEQMANDIRKYFGLPISNLNSEQSETAKSLMWNAKRTGLINPALAEEEYMVKNNFMDKTI